MKVDAMLETPLGKIAIKLKDQAVTDVILTPEDHRVSQSTDDATTVMKALKAYFANPNYEFALPVQPAGTEFQKRVWHALCNIPAGTTLTYGELAKQLKSSPRAVGQACKRNPIPIIIPCHRVTSTRGLGGYMGRTSGTNIDIKQWLLHHESRRS